MSADERFQTKLYSRRTTFCGSEAMPHIWGARRGWFGRRRRPTPSPLIGDRCHRCGARYELTGVAWHEVDPDRAVLR